MTEQRPHVQNGGCALCGECKARQGYPGDLGHCPEHVAYDEGYEQGHEAMLAELRTKGMVWTEPSGDSLFEGEYGLIMEPGKQYVLIALPVEEESDADKR